ncbi:MAG: GNAT family N-acetyltransferase [Leptolyngbyaceae cyanobacterium MO_188.B28]|nr:GNAT family N-acetyltransferase [Leptolyngbyaceae cyanobacterium MO_188.B28]
MAGSIFFVAESAGEIVGFYGVERLSLLQFELEALFVEPVHMGLGIGRALMTHAKNFIAESGGSTLLIQGDPNAEGFYRALGAQLIGKKESASIPGRFLPMFLIEVSGGEDTRIITP